MTPLLEISGLRVAFGDDEERRLAVDDVDLQLAKGERLALVGESGSGKSLSALAILGLLPRDATVAARRLAFDGEDLLAMSPRDRRALGGRRIAMVFQDPLTALDPFLTVGEQIHEAIRRRHRERRRAVRERAVALLEEVGVPDPRRRLRAFPHELSGGLRQRVMIAMALAGEPELLVADEPTTALDVTVQAQVLELFRELCARREMSLLLITHDLGVVAGLADRTAVLYAGRLVEEGATRELFYRPRHPYTRALLATLPRLDAQRGEQLPVIEGRLPGLGERGPGCPFAPRCAERFEPCEAERPPWSGPVASREGAACHLEEPG